MKHQSENRSTDNGGSVSEWEDDGGARRADTGRLDASHQSDTRGEHRYDDAHQTASEQEARRNRDALKQRLGRR